MRWHLKIPGEKNPVSVELLKIEDNGSRFCFRIDGKKEVSLTRPRVFDFGLETDEVRLEIESWASNKWRGCIDGTLYTIEPSVQGEGSGSQAKEIRSLMPGRVLKVLVKAGDEVKENDSLLVIEAMKMENEIRSPRSGKISKISANAGASVEANALLLEFA